MKRTLLIAALFASATVPALAADLPYKAPRPAPVMIPVVNWTGFYIGINGGYSWGKAGRELSFFNPLTGIQIIPPVGSGATSDSNLDGGVLAAFSETLIRVDGVKRRCSSCSNTMYNVIIFASEAG